MVITGDSLRTTKGWPQVQTAGSLKKSCAGAGSAGSRRSRSTSTSEAINSAVPRCNRTRVRFLTGFAIVSASTISAVKMRLGAR